MGRKDRKKNNDYWDNEFEQDQELLDDSKPAEVATEEPVNNQKKKGKSVDKKEPAKKEQAKTEEEPAPAPAEDTPSSSSNKKKNNKKKNKKTDEPVQVEEAPKAEEKSTGKKKKGGISKSLQAALIKQREEDERRKQEELEQEKKDEERRIQRQKREEEEKQKREEEKRIKEEERKKLNEQKKKEAAKQKQQEVLARLGTNIQLPASTDSQETAPKKQSNMYSSRKKKKPVTSAKLENQRNENVSTPNQTSASKTDNQADDDLLSGGDLLDNWEDFDLETEEDSTKHEEPKPEKTPQVAATKKTENTPAATDKTQPTPPPSQNTEAAPQDNSEVSDPSEDPTLDSKEDNKNLRSPIICILGHVDTGKTKLLDKIRRTNVQEGEAGGITQQIGATWFPMENLEKLTSKIQTKSSLKSELPGLLVIDTPGHESFSNLRSRGSNLCDIAILVVDVMHGLEPQTLESINMLKKKKTPFVVALNKIDRLYSWKENTNAPIQESLKKQNKSVQEEYESKVKETITAFAEQGLNAQLYYKQKSLKDFRNYVSLIPTSAITGEGIPDILMLLVQLTQRLMAERLLYLTTLQCTVLEVKVVEGLGTTIDVILVNGTLNEGDRIVVCGMNGPIVTTIRGLLTPQPLKEMRVKGTYQHHKQIKAAQGVKIIGKDLDNAVAGSSLFVVGPNDDIEQIKGEVMADLENMRKKVNKQDVGVYVQASTLGSLEALLEFLHDCKIPVAGINIGPVNKKDVTRASIMLNRVREYAVILAFDVKLNPQAVETAESLGVEIFRADIIYHLFDQFSQYMENIKEKKKNEARNLAVFPCALKILKCFNAKNPLVLGVRVTEGTLRVGTPLTALNEKVCDIGKVTSIERDNKEFKIGKVGDEVAIKVELPETEQQKTFDRHFTIDDEIVSKVSRQSLDALKDCFRDELTKEDVALLIRLKQIFNFY